MAAEHLDHATATQPAPPPAAASSKHHASLAKSPPSKLSIVIPAYNEAATIHELIGLVVNAPLPGGLSRELIIVDDYSTDGT